MMSSLKISILLFMLLQKCLHAVHYYDYEAMENKAMELTDPWKEKESVKEISVVERCTRRYAPGTCTEPVASVWTFSLEKKDCIERLGCPTPSTLNRFLSHRRCMETCVRLVWAYQRLVRGRGRSNNHDSDSDSDEAVKLMLETMSSPVLRQRNPAVQELLEDDYSNQYSDSEDSELEEEMMEEKDWLPQSIFEGDVLESDVDLA